MSNFDFIKIGRCIPEIGEKMPPKVLMWFCCDLDLWPQNFIKSTLCLYKEDHRCIRMSVKDIDSDVIIWKDQCLSSTPNQITFSQVLVLSVLYNVVETWSLFAISLSFAERSILDIRWYQVSRYRQSVHRSPVFLLGRGGDAGNVPHGVPSVSKEGMHFAR